MVSLQCAVIFANGLRIPTGVHQTTPSTSSYESEIKTDLVAPAPTSNSQFFKSPNQEQFLYAALLHNVHFLPFEIADGFDNEESQNDEGNTYKIYRPTPEDDPQFIDMLPPSQHQDEPNYYDEKPRKTKKYSKSIEEAKQKKHSIKEDRKNQESYRKEGESDNEHSQSEAVEQQTEQDEQTDDYSVEQSAPASRLDFQLHGNLSE